VPIVRNTPNASKYHSVIGPRLLYKKGRGHNP